MAKSNKKQNQIALIMVLVIAVMLALLVVVNTISKHIPSNPKGTVGNSSGNLNNGGLFVEDKDGVIYFVNPYDNYFIYSMNSDGTDIKKIKDVSAEYLNLGGKYLYFNQKESLQTDTFFGLTGSIHGVYRMKKNDGKDMRGLDRTVAGVVTLIDDTLFYQHSDEVMGTTLFSVSTDGKNQEMISDKFISPACVVNGDILFPDKDNNFLLSVFDTENGSISQLNSERAYNPTKDGDYIYYIDANQGYCLSRLDLTRNSVEILTTDRVDCFNVYGDSIFYQKNDQSNPALIFMRSNGSEKHEIAGGNYTNINTTSLYTYFQPFENQNVLYRFPTSGSGGAEEFYIAAENTKK